MKRMLVTLAVLAVPLALVGVRYGPVGWDWFIADQSCVGCHRQSNDQLVAQWMGSAHFSAGVRCESCHGDRHDAIFAAGGDVSSKVCAECHEAEYTEFSRSGHPEAEVAATTNARFIAAPEAMQRSGCMTCHAIGRTFPDGGQGSCNYCHTGHRFSAEEAREPAACEVCHIGPDHPQMEAWRASKHGLVYQAMQDAESAPTCVSCHMGAPPAMTPPAT
ncbi:MAG: multiheme c-type cytochrome [bacterium]